mmetsp:Transcript_76585/g.212751  ORF Transcript_76585/g.212751 Transcript_76585/m.212751 type:complete len:337 (-) Transcript_76585:87-1097(-)
MGNDTSSFNNFFECSSFTDEQARHRKTNSGRSSPACIADVESEDEGDLDDVYDIDSSKHIGTGKFSVVQLCWRKDQPEKKYALKVISTATAGAASMNQVLEEINILQTLGGHPGLVELVEVDMSLSDCIRLVLELCEGGELYDRIHQNHHLAESEARLCVRNLLDAVAFIHSRGVMHRDMKPENILMVSRCSNTDIKISDFGLARMSRDFPAKLPRASSICGSDFYLAPELIKQQEYGREVDIWALGVISYIILSGCLPFYSEILHKLYRKIVERDLTFAEKEWRHVSKGAQDFILRTLQVRPGDRPTAEDALCHPWVFDMGSSMAITGNRHVHHG